MHKCCSSEYITMSLQGGEAAKPVFLVLFKSMDCKSIHLWAGEMAHQEKGLLHKPDALSSPPEIMVERRRRPHTYHSRYMPVLIPLIIHMHSNNR